MTGESFLSRMKAEVFLGLVKKVSKVVEEAAVVLVVPIQMISFGCFSAEERVLSN